MGRSPRARRSLREQGRVWSTFPRLRSPKWGKDLASCPAHTATPVFETIKRPKYADDLEQCPDRNKSPINTVTATAICKAGKENCIAGRPRGRSPSGHFFCLQTKPEQQRTVRRHPNYTEHATPLSGLKGELRPVPSPAARRARTRLSPDRAGPPRTPDVLSEVLGLLGLLGCL